MPEHKHGFLPDNRWWWKEVISDAVSEPIWSKQGTTGTFAGYISSQ
jgi:hypothetical protein